MEKSNWLLIGGVIIVVIVIIAVFMSGMGDTAAAPGRDMGRDNRLARVRAPARYESWGSFAPVRYNAPDRC